MLSRVVVVAWLVNSVSVPVADYRLTFGVGSRDLEVQVIASQSAIAVGIDDPCVTANHTDLIDSISIKIANNRFITLSSELCFVVSLGPPSVSVRIQQPRATSENRDLIDAITVPVT